MLDFGFAVIKILQNMVANGRLFINDGAVHSQLPALVIVKNTGHHGHLFFYDGLHKVRFLLPTTFIALDRLALTDVPIKKEL